MGRKGYRKRTDFQGRNTHGCSRGLKGTDSFSGRGGAYKNYYQYNVVFKDADMSSQKLG